MIDVLFVIASRIETQTHLDHLHTAVASIKQHFGLHEQQQIMIVDSDSPSRSHIEQFKAHPYIIFEDIHNKNYEAGAWLHAYNTVLANRYVFLHDSCAVVENFSDAFNQDVAIWKDYGAWKDITMPQRLWVESKLSNTKWNIMPDDFAMVQGSIFSASRNLLDVLYTNGLQHILPETKSDAMAFERLLGVVLHHEGYTHLVRTTQLHTKLHKVFLKRG